MRAARNIIGLLRLYYHAVNRMGREIDHFNLSPDFFESFRRHEDKPEKTLIMPGGKTIPVKSYGWELNGDNYYRMGMSASGRPNIFKDLETVLK